MSKFVLIINMGAIIEKGNIISIIVSIVTECY